MPAHVGWGTESFGSSNSWRGEYDTVRYFAVYLGLPVYFSFRGCVHVIDPYHIQPGERLEQLRGFARTYLGVPNLSGPVHLPLKPLRHLKRLVFYELGLCLLGCFAVVAVVATPAILQQPRPFVPENVAFLTGAWAGTALFLACLALYLFTRRPSRRQARIRGAVASCLGPFSDPAEWRADLLACVAPDFGVARLDAGELLEAAERRLRSREYGAALVLARMVLGLGGASAGDEVAGRAADITEECLLHLGAAHSSGF